MPGKHKERKKALIIINPVAGDGRALRVLPELIRSLSDGGYIASVLTTQEKGSATEYAEKYGADCELVVCSGGDGTANEVIRGIMRHPAEKRPKFGFIPCGSTNDFANTLGIPKRPLNAVETLLHGRTIPVDVGSFEDRCYANTCAFGAFTNISYDTPQTAKNIFGPLAYLAKGLETFWYIKPIRLRLVINGEEIDDRFAFGAISNTHIIGGVIRLKKTWVELNDGMFEILLIRYPEEIGGFTKIWSAISTGELNCEYIRIYHAPEVDITVMEDDPIDFSLDGERVTGVKHTHISNIRSGIRCIVKEEKRVPKRK